MAENDDRPRDGSVASTPFVAGPGRGDAAALHRWIIGTSIVLTLAAHHVHRAAALYLIPGGHPYLGTAGVLVGLPLAWGVARRHRSPRAEALPWLLLCAATATGGLAVIPFVTFDAGAAATLAPETCTVLASLLVLLSLGATWEVVARPALSLDVARTLRRPLWLAALAAGVALALAASGHVGFLRTGLCLSALLALAASAYPRRHAFLHGAPLASARALALAAAGTAALVLGALGVTLQALPLRELARYPDEVVFAVDGRAHRLVVVAAPGGYELFRDGQLAVATLDEHRRAAALARPALGAATRHAGVLLLHGGMGTVERAILSSPGVESLTVVVEDAELPRLAHRMPWLATLAGGSLEDPRLHPVVAEPIVWLAAHPGHYDVVIDDLPAPTGYREGKHYTAYYFGLLAAHLSADGLLVIPAASAFATNDAFSTIVATLRGSGLVPSVYHAAIPTLGVTSFVVGSRHGASTEWLARAPGVPLDHGGDLAATRDAETATLHDQRVVALFRDAPDRR